MLEREVKLGAGPGFHLPDLAGVAEVGGDEVSVRDGRGVAARCRDMGIGGEGDAGLAQGAPKPGGEGIFAPLTARLRGGGRGAPGPTPKHIRALGPRAVEPAEV